MSANSRIIQFGYYEHEVYEEGGKQKHRARCRFCGTMAPKLTEFKGTTSGFTRHLKRVHKAKWEEYMMLKTSPENTQLSTFLQPSAGCSYRIPSDGESPMAKYRQTNTRQMQVSEAVTKFVIGCSLPLSIVEDKHFRNLLQCLDPRKRYQPMSRSTLTGRVLPQLQMEVKEKILNMLAQHSNVSLTADIWTDRTTRSFLGVTAHIMGTNPKTGSYGLISLLLTCQHFSGKKAGEKIPQAFETVIEDYNIGNKVDYIVTDHAANMKRAFQVKFPVKADQDAPMGDEEYPEVEDETLWEELYQEDVTAVDAALHWQANSRQTLSCFAHTLQLVVGDGLKDMKCVVGAIAKVTKISALIHKSSVFKARFEGKFGVGKTIPAAVTTRWNSTYHQIKSLLEIEGMEYNSLAEVCDMQELAHVMPTSHEWGELTELCTILEPFAEATNLTQGERSATICQVVPVVLDINSHLTIWKDEAHFCKTLVIALQSSLQKRFKGIFINCCMAAEREPGDTKEPFMDKIYLVSAVLDPQYMLHWIDADVTVDGDTQNTRESLKETLKAGLKELVIMETEKLLIGENSDEMGQTTANAVDHFGSSGDFEDPQAKVPRLLAKYRTMGGCTQSAGKDPVRVQLNKYLRNEEGYGMDAVTFWKEDGAAKLKYPSLYILAKNIICVPASSAPVEHIFSKGGMTVRPHRAQLSPQMFETLMFLKCNEHIL